MRKALTVIAVILGALYLWNASWIAGASEDPKIRLIAHRGVHQQFDRDGIDAEDDLMLIPAGFDGYIWTNRIETIGPLIRERRAETERR